MEMTMSIKKVETPLTAADVEELRIGDQVLLTGVVYTARDSAHMRIAGLLRENLPLPFDLEGSVIYYVGPSPARPGRVIGSAGPTTSCRMDPYTLQMLEHGLRGMIGKGQRSPEVLRAMKEHRSVYFGATGGAAALISGAIVEAKVIAFEDLGTEAVRRLVVKDMPLIVVNDCYGQDLYARGRERWAAEPGPAGQS